MTKEELAVKINGKQYGNELDGIIDIPDNLVVVFGASDDLCEFNGAINEEIGCYNGGVITFTKDGKFPSEDDFETLEKYNVNVPIYKIEAVWSPKEPDCSWIYKTDIPHATFQVLEEDELYCVGIVFDINDLN